MNQVRKQVIAESLAKGASKQEAQTAWIEHRAFLISQLSEAEKKRRRFR